MQYCALVANTKSIDDLKALFGIVELCVVFDVPIKMFYKKNQKRCFT